MERVVVITDPTNRPTYVKRFVELFLRHWGIRTVLVYPHVVSRALIAECSAHIGDAGIAARYQVDESDLTPLARQLRSRFRVQAVIPQAEVQVGVAAALCDLLDIDWVPLETISRFRNKFALKDYLRNQPGAPRLNKSACVTGLEQTLEYVAAHDLKRFVLKPNDGAGNSRIAFFDADAHPQHVRVYFEQNRDTEILLEEFIEGPEFCVNGQVDETGSVHVYSVQRATYQSGNGRTNLAGGFQMLPTDTREFQLGAQYAVDILSASGLRRSPFHMDLKIDEDGPSMIEAGARLGGAGIPADTQLAHGGAIDMFYEAARCYLPEVPGTPGKPDWTAYDAHFVWTVLGLAPRSEQIVDLHGVAEVEALPEFAYWIMQPRIGQRVQQTIDLATAPWQVTLRGTSNERMQDLEHSVRAQVCWNINPRPVQRLQAKAAWARRRLPALPYLVSRRPIRVDTP